MSNEPKYLQIARSDIGIKEIKGPKTATRISSWLSRLGAWWSDDETPWCGVALAGWLTEAGLIPPKAYYRALEWQNFGVTCGPKLGAIAVLGRKGGGHVGIVTGVSDDLKHVRLIGGNQGDSVCEAWFPAERVVDFRRPVSIDLSSAQVCNVGQLSSKES